jgi:hypothetical protein
VAAGERHSQLDPDSVCANVAAGIVYTALRSGLTNAATARLDHALSRAVELRAR